MVTIDPDALSERDNYKLMIGSIIPRPIAWVTTLTPSGTVNAAPFSYFNIVTANPPLVSISVGRRDGAMKDTSRNAAALGEFVVHIPDERNVGAMNRTAAALGPEESELDAAGLTAVPSEAVRVPGIAEAAVRLECVLERIVPLGGTEESPASDLLIGRIVRYHFRDGVYDAGHIDPAALRPVSRLAGTGYAKLGEIFHLDRP
ncbi:NADH-FMN oxidoreductase RutF, flavin reductase (DIM6/NTAB) family [Paenibacillus sp. UNC496MF]|uniref:flavin reductase family protein n=1 Tax=Paenibacillus sp. UNC496MF TaxID=1502753 RepID=UPI0008E7C386|nr:flavin reductase family protein [Paenibacillus sp. UNC496MF]SFJ15283.1 NADH-FMN oxidoreductase RutF, flavin reductase (DIM6/NTAB) family [Paenibacillus sp. UNC496MF]